MAKKDVSIPYRYGITEFNSKAQEIISREVSIPYRYGITIMAFNRIDC